jgi:hypothetical protein
VWRYVFAFVGLFLVWFFLQLFWPSPAIVISKETTYITEPLRADGLPDYEKYVLDRMREGVTPENNAAVLLAQVLWPEDLEPDELALIATELGLPELPSQQRTLVHLTGDSTTMRVAAWMKDNLDGFKATAIDESLGDRINVNEANETDDGTNFVLAQRPDLESLANEWIQLSMSCPWTSGDIPPLADWLRDNESAIDLIIAATKRPRCYFPSPSHLNGVTEPLMFAKLPYLQACRHAARAIAARCLWNVGERRIAAAWEESLAVHRLARLVANGPTLVEQLIAIELDRVACRLDARILDDPHLTSALSRQMLHELSALPRITTVWRTIRDHERLAGLDAISHVRSDGIGALTGLNEDGFIEKLPTRFAFDWSLVLFDLNDWYDRLASASMYEARAVRKQAQDRIDWERGQLSAEIASPGSLVGIISRQKRSRVLASVLASLMLPAIGAVNGAADRGETVLTITRIAAALAVYRSEHGEYPPSLDYLVPGILEELPLDIFSDQPFIYRTTDDRGFLLYSVFDNGADDGGTDPSRKIVNGKWVEASDDLAPNYENWDIVIRFPMPALQLPKLETSD